MRNDDKRYEKLVVDYFEKQRKFKLISDKFNEAKKEFYSKMDELFKDRQEDTFVVDLFADKTEIKVKKIQGVKVIFDADALEKKLPKDIKNVVIKKRYEINNMDKLVEYLKSCGVNPKVFKQFLIINKSVDVKMLEQFESIGKISEEQIKGCYSVKTNDPYYKVSGGKEQGDNW